MIDYSFLGIEGLTGDKLVRVWKRANGRVSYVLEDPKVRREWSRNDEVKMISFHELYTLSNDPGGKGILEYFLLIKDQDVLKALNLPLDPEYQYTEEDCKTLVLKGTKDQILDALEFGGYGVATLIKKQAIDSKIDSSERKKLLNGIFNFDLDAIYSNKEWAEMDTDKTSETRQRRAKPLTSTETEESKPKRKRKSEALTPSEPEENLITE
jgi:hypothetical protein